LKTSLTHPSDLFENGSFDLPCSPCETMGRYSTAEWIVQFARPNPGGDQDFLLCDDCLTRWRRYGFGVLHETDASWTHL
jgi:hypothetical protein